MAGSLCGGRTPKTSLMSYMIWGSTLRPSGSVVVVPVGITLLTPARKATAQFARHQSVEWMAELGQYLPAVVLEATGLHLLSGQDQVAGLVIERPAGLSIPLVPPVDTLSDQPSVENVRAVVRTDDFADVR